MTKGEKLEYAITKECCTFSLVEWCYEWGVTIDDFEEFLRLGREAFDSEYKGGAEPVVRCKDCKNCEMGAITAQYSDGSVKEENLCYRNKWSVRGTDYCSYAEPKE